MSEHLALRSSVGSRSSALPSYHHLPASHQQPPDPLTSVWIRRLHLLPDQPQPPPPHPPQHQDAVSTDESRTPPSASLRTAGFGPFRWSPHPLRGAALGSWDTVNAAAPAPTPVGSCGGPPMLSPFFRLPALPPPPVADIGEFAPAMSLIGVGSSGSGRGGFAGLSSRMVVGGGTHAVRFAMGAAVSAYPSHAVDIVPVRTIHDIHGRQARVIPANFAGRASSSGGQHDEPVSYWDMWRFRRNTTTSSISQIGATPGNFGKKRNADPNNFLPLKSRRV
ncbi:hypothetical protein GUJ93_ZPchr0003g17399 [Zizania palustris]|uniref:Uncharacterized protein n=1 Tax=Zizania palustris TaxID=103762 RepID=A0A8J5SKL4_ZIZPA|nr:hypothetical protein GUJ93_ZPchr0003g17399 [Zizania palustris]